MDLITEIEKHWPVITAIAGLTIMVIRSEGRVGNMEKRVDHLDNQVQTMESGLVKEMSEVKQSLARIEGYLKGLREGDPER